MSALPLALVLPQGGHILVAISREICAKTAEYIFVTRHFFRPRKNVVTPQNAAPIGTCRPERMAPRPLSTPLLWTFSTRK